MLQQFRRSGRVTRLIGVAISYVFALHVVLASLVASQMAVASSDPYAICLTDKSTDQKAPTKPHGGFHHVACAICAFVAFSATLPGDNASLIAPDAFELVASTGLEVRVCVQDRHDRVAQEDLRKSCKSKPLTTRWRFLCNA